MTNDLRLPKRRIPSPSKFTVPRQRTPVPVAGTPRGSLDRGSVVLVAGSVGSGKTSLLAAWARALQERGDRVGWVSLGREDNDPHQLQSTLLDALRDATRGLDGTAASLATYAAPPLADPQFIGTLVAAVGSLPVDVWLLLDDVHDVREPEAREALDVLLRWAGPNLHVVLGARSEPALHLGRLRVEGRLVEVRDADLRFTRDETAQLLAAHGVALDDQQTATVHELTEGWAAAIGLAALSLSDGRDPDEFLRRFASEDRALAGYLVEEVLAGLDEDTRLFLLVTSVPQRVNAELAAHLTGRDDAGALLARLAETNSLVAVTEGGAQRLGTDLRRGGDGFDSLDAAAGEASAVYRYHPLLASYLRTMLQSQSRSRAARARAATALWIAGAGGTFPALEHAAASQDPAVLASVLRCCALGILLDGRGQRLHELLTRCPEGMGADPLTLVVRSLADLDVGDLDSAAAHLRAAEERLRAAPEPPETAADSFTARLLAVAVLHLVRLGGHLAAEVLPSARPDGPAVRSGAPPSATQEAQLRLLEDLEQGLWKLSLGRFQEGRPRLEAAAAAARRLDHPFTVMACMAALAGVFGASGDLTAMRQQAEDALRFARARGWARSPRLLLAYTMGAAAAYESFDLDQAGRLLDAATDIVADLGPDREPDAGRTSGAVLASERSRRVLDADVARSVSGIRRAVDFEAAHGDERRQRALAVSEARLLLSEGVASLAKPLVAAEFGQAHRRALAVGEVFLAEQLEQLVQGADIPVDRGVMRGLRLLATGAEEQARGAVRSVVQGAASPVTVRNAVTARLVETTVAVRRGQAAAAHETLLAALRLAQNGGGMRMLVDIAPEVTTLLRDGRGRFGRHEEWVQRVLTAVSRTPPTYSAGKPGSPVGKLRSVDAALSSRELALLAELPSMLPVAEIAAAHGVSPNTIKTQMRSLYTKLGVSTRRDAVAEGRRRELI